MRDTKSVEQGAEDLMISGVFTTIEEGRTQILKVANENRIPVDDDLIEFNNWCDILNAIKNPDIPA